ncbi:hypothetical protein SAMN05216404_1267 [Nitrosospira multiformis]|uniref:Uncharacterized protein n=1 Tax=Nitrosospira multiformis TaxID=1231 RepID=A0A1H8Q2Q5_9PROT|nr:hypothetical protein SAMN05216404_1267 [Nitrosospira multiformis]
MIRITHDTYHREIGITHDTYHREIGIMGDTLTIFFYILKKISY